MLSPLPGVTFAGFLHSPTGIGVAGQGTLLGLAAANIPFETLDIRPESVSPNVTKSRFPINLLHVNPDIIMRIRSGAAPYQHYSGFLGRNTSIAFWAWEIENSLPENFRQVAPLFREIWVPSEFTKRSLSSLSTPVHVVPHVVEPPSALRDRTFFGISNDATVFLYMFDGHSNFERKNPLGLIRAYLLAFPVASAATTLLLKVKNLTPDESSLLSSARMGRADIRILEQDMSSQELHSLISSSDCYVSLHRSEGFGLTMAEAMYHGKPVIATGYSGNLDFMTLGNSLLLPYTLTELKQNSGYYQAGSRWAEPSVEQAAQRMLQVAHAPQWASAIGERAARSIREQLNTAVVGEAMRTRLERVWTVIQQNQPALSPPTLPMCVTASRAESLLPSVLILTPVKNAARNIDKHFELLKRLSYPHDRISLGFLDGDSTDGTFELLKAKASLMQEEFASISLSQRNFGFNPPGPRWAPEIQRQRRDILARSRNLLLFSALRDQDWVLWIDSDMIDYPTDLIQQLLAAKKSILTPHTVLPNGKSYDLNTFILDYPTGTPEKPEYLVGDIFLSPVGAGRHYLDSHKHESLIQVDGVGGTILLVEADLHRQGLIFPAYSHRGYIETEGLAMMAKDMGVTSWAMPQLYATHANA